MSDVLIVEDKKNLRIALKNILCEAGYKVFEAEDISTAKILIEKNSPVTAVIDVRLPDGSGLDLLDHLTECGKSVITIMMSAYGDIPVAVSAMKKGAKDFVTKPFEPYELLDIIKRELGLAESSAKYSEDTFEPAGNSKLWLKVLDLAKNVAKMDSTVLLSGETGSGKEVVAKYIHGKSKRAKFPFIPVNCAALPRELVESELFGAESGAFTGIGKTRQGKFESAGGGTVFLDEIGDLSEEAQAKILRILETKKIQRLGSASSIDVDVRIISATNKKLEEEIEKGRFREDLFYRLAVFPIEIPPLRDRPDDIEDIARQLVKRISLKIDRDFNPEIGKDVLDKLASHNWPGNVRELANVIERAMILSVDTTIDPEKIYLPDRKRETEIHRAKMDREKDVIKRALESAGWKRTEAAKILGISYRSLLEKIKKYELREN